MFLHGERLIGLILCKDVIELASCPLFNRRCDYLATQSIIRGIISERDPQCTSFDLQSFQYYIKGRKDHPILKGYSYPLTYRSYT